MSDYKFIEQFKIEIVNQMIELDLKKEDKVIINKIIDAFIAEVEYNIEECLNDIKRREHSHNEEVRKLDGLIVTIKSLVDNYENNKNRKEAKT